MTRRIATVVNDRTGRTARIYHDARQQEFVVRLAGCPMADYFTDDKDDAFQTAAWMTANAAECEAIRREQQ